MIRAHFGCYELSDNLNGQRHSSESRDGCLTLTHPEASSMQIALHMSLIIDCKAFHMKVCKFTVLVAVLKNLSPLVNG